MSLLTPDTARPGLATRPRRPADEAPSAPPPRCPRYASLDAWRGLACLAVVVYHAAEHPFRTFADPKTGDPAGRAVL